ncbi:DUF418 domain-containing protein [Agrococcus casei]|uniref:DUF418 domain-containing protein n=2 Tax=Agrococcus casei TaxID=343512 RepID=UPI003F8FC237
MSRPSEGRELVMNTPPPVARAFAPDLARGFMLLLIAMANVSWFLYGRDFGMAGAHPLDGTALDRALQAFMMIAVDGRAYPLFAFLFGYGMVQFTRSRIARGIEYREVRRMLRRRHWAMLLAFGLPHAALLFMGDIVGAYGLVGLVLVGIFFDRTDRTLTICVWVLAGLMALFAVFSLVGGIAAAVFMPTGALESADVSRDLTVATESYLASIGGRLMMWASIGVVQGFFSAVPLCILLGWLAARHGVLDDPARHRRLLTRVAVVGIPVGLLGGMPTALTHLGVFGLPSWAFSGVDFVLGAAGALGYVALFGLIAARWQSAPPAVALWIAAVGKWSLTFYLLQSLVFAPLFSAWGFGLGGSLGTAGALGIAVLVWIVSVLLAVLLESRGARGPAEVLLRRLTYGRQRVAADAR